MIKAVFRFIGGVFRFIFRCVDFLRRALLNLVLIGVLAALAFAWWKPAPGIDEGSVLVLRPSGMLVEQTSASSPLDLIRPDSGAVAETALRDLLDAVRAAREDERIAALVIETDDLAGGGIARLAELRAEIAAFRDAGKPVLARGERFTEGQYYLASVADEVHLSPDGFLLLRGLASYANYFGSALEKLGVKVHVFRVGEYKSFAEPFTREDMSPESRENTRDLLTGLWGALREDIAASRKLGPAAIDAWVRYFVDALEAADGSPARAALDAGLVDRLSTADEWRATLSERFGLVERRFGGGKAVSVGRYLAAQPERETSGRVAVLVARGAIMDGNGTPGTVGGDSFARLIREVRDDPAVSALVVRIDSPGGSAWASEQIRRELELTRRSGKPVIASMSATAASGGYWIATGSDEIHAHPLTLTGSIGIFALFPDLSGPLDRLGVSVDGVATGPFAGVPDPRRPLSPEAVEVMQRSLDFGYRRFLQTVADARGMSVEDVDRVARGRVWTGEAAHKLGLVDALGGLHGAIAAAADRVGLEEYEVVWPEPAASPRERLMRSLGEFVSTDSSPAPQGAFGMLFASLQREAAALLTWNDPRHLYVHCLCEAP
ncbi:MAG: signal peptide peptidase SppA [Pseudazoarcus pumilus]|nr:signal peptide peptidase SppA [Pseudazoarcus pumilus]